jgi:hypothetical protein
LAAFKEKNPNSQEKRCMCPECGHDFGLLKDLQENE